MKSLASGDGIIMLPGCLPWSAASAKKQPCPVCHGATRSDKRLVVCLWCHAVSPTLAKLIGRATYGRSDHTGREVARQATRKQVASLERSHGGRVLDEQTRRRIWNGYDGRYHREADSPNNAAKIGRDWLRSIGQEPDFSRILDRRGEEIGRYEEITIGELIEV